MTSHRHMDKSDLHRVNLLLSKSFTHGRIEDGYRETQVPLCRIEFLEMYLAGCPEGSFVIEVNGEMVAYAFSHLWGSVGWVGPLGVLPAEQCKGYGTEIVSRCVQYLKSAGAKTIGLETMPRSYKNLGFYCKLGFLPQQLCLDLTEQVCPKPYPRAASDLELVSFDRCSAAERGIFLARARKLTHRIQPGLDYSTLISLTHEFNFGQSLLVRKSGRTVGLVVAHSEPYGAEEKRDLLRVNLLLLDPRAPMRILDDLLPELEEIARSQYLGQLCVRVQARCWKGWQFFLAKGFKIVHSDLRMTLEGYPEGGDAECIHLNRWE